MARLYPVDLPPGFVQRQVQQVGSTSASIANLAVLL
jgi:hypothetical protein